MKPIHLALALTCVQFSSPALPEQFPIEPQTQGEVRFISGGVGVDEVRALQAVRAQYNLSLLFSEKGTGEFLGNVKVQITNSAGNSYLETVSDGPMLFAKLRPGRYIVTADQDGQQLQKTATIGLKRMTSLSFTWPRQK